MEFKNVSAAVPRATDRVRGLRTRLVMAGDATSLEFALPASFFLKVARRGRAKCALSAYHPTGVSTGLVDINPGAVSGVSFLTSTLELRPPASYFSRRPGGKSSGVPSLNPALD